MNIFVVFTGGAKRGMVTLGESPKGFQVLEIESGVNESAALPTRQENY